MASAAADFRTEPLKDGFGVEITGIDLATASDALIAQVVEAFHRHGALVLRDQHIPPAALVRFGSAFGKLEGHTMQDFVIPGHPEVYVLSNRLDEDGKPVGAHNDGIGWHTDLNYQAEPAMCTMLHAQIVPPEGSDTLLADSVAAYESLSAEEKAKLAPLKLCHSLEYMLQVREHGRKSAPPEVIARTPDVIHPLIRTHPADGRKAIWAAASTRGIVGWDPAESAKLIGELFAYVTQDRFVYRHKWRVGDILVWDNRCTLHRGTLFDDARYIREVHRMWVKGDRPF